MTDLKKNLVLEIISQGKIKDQIYLLPEIQIGRKLYLKVAEHLKFLGGKWNKTKNGFIFDRQIESVDELLVENSKKEIQFFSTPNCLAKELCEFAEIDNYTAPILEPSAGRGAIIKQIQEMCSCQIDYFEINEVNRKYLNEFNEVNDLGEDFLKSNGEKMYDRIIANPPFSKNQDVDHILKMYDHLDENGILVSLSSPHWIIGKEKKCVEFRKFLKLINAEIINVESGRFKNSGTMIGSKIILIKK